MKLMPLILFVATEGLLQDLDLEGDISTPVQINQGKLSTSDEPRKDTVLRDAWLYSLCLIINYAWFIELFYKIKLCYQSIHDFLAWYMISWISLKIILFRFLTYVCFFEIDMEMLPNFEIFL